MANLKVRCSMGVETDVRFKVSVKTIPENRLVFSETFAPNTTITVPLEPRKYQLEISNNACLSPRKIVKYLDFTRQCEYGYNPVYTAPLRIPVRTLDIRVTDRNYPNIIPINGGITVCRLSTR